MALRVGEKILESVFSVCVVNICMPKLPHPFAGEWIWYVGRLDLLIFSLILIGPLHAFSRWQCPFWAVCMPGSTWCLTRVGTHFHNEIWVLTSHISLPVALPLSCIRTLKASSETHFDETVSHLSSRSLDNTSLGKFFISTPRMG